jgi:hypothetical protein
MADHPAGIDRAGLDVFHLQPGVSLQNRFGGIPRRKHSQNVLRSDVAEGTKEVTLQPDRLFL